MPRVVKQLPITPPRLPDKLPFEDQLGRGVNKVLDLTARDPVLKAVNRVVEKIPIYESKEFPTPFGTYKTPEFYIPKIEPARMDGRQREAFKASVVKDLAWAGTLIPGVSDAAEPVLDAVNDTAQAKITDTLTPEELKYFLSYNKVDPLNCVAMIRAMLRTQKEQ